MVRGEEKQFEVTIDRLLDYTKNIKISLLRFNQYLEQGDNMEWTQVLDLFTTICGQINTLMRFTRENKASFIENRAVLPLLLSPDRDEELFKLTEGRVQMVNHEMVPDYLRTKPDPEIEENEKAIQLKANATSTEAAVKQLNAMNKLVDNIIGTIRTSSARADTELSRQAIRPSFNNNDTHELILAISNGKGLRSGPMMHARNMFGHEPILGPKPHEQIMQPQMAPKQNPKAPELKTNIKAGP